MKTALISFVIGCVGIASVNAVRPIEDTKSSVILTFVIALFAFVYINLWKSKRRRK